MQSTSNPRVFQDSGSWRRKQWSGACSFLHGGRGLTRHLELAIRLEVFVAGADGHLYHIAERSGGGWTRWISTGSFAIQNDPIIGRNKDGRMDVFFRGSDNALWHLWQVTVNSTWVTSPSTLGGVLASGPDVGPNADGRLQVFWRAASGSLQSMWQTGNSASPWVAPQDLGGSLACF